METLSLNHKAPRPKSHQKWLEVPMHVCLRKLAAHKAPSLTPWQILEHLRKIVLVNVEFETRDGRLLTLPRITIPEKEQAALLMHLGWNLPAQPPPSIRTPEIKKGN